MARTIIRRDYIVCLLGLTPLLFWTVAAVALLLTEMSGGYILTATLYTLLTPPLAFWRYRRVQHIIGRGTLLRGEVRRNLHQGWRGRLEFSYSVSGKEYLGVQPYMRTPEAERLNPGTTVRIRVDPRAPHHALLPALFEDL